MISTIRLKKCTSTFSPASSVIHSGVMMGAIIVVTAVTVTDSARLDLAMNAMTFDASPLEHEPIKIIPAAISGSKWKIFVSAKPTSGITVKWQKIPTNTPRGDFATPAKSRRLICVPMPNITS